MKKISSLLLSLIALPLIIGGCSNSSSEEPYNPGGGGGGSGTYFNDEQGLAFYPLDDGTFGVRIGYATELSKIEIPAMFRSKTVTTILENGFQNNSHYGEENKLRNITLPDTIKVIENHSFSFDLLEEFKYDGSTKSFGEIEFHECWYDNDVNSDLKFIFSDKTFKYSETYNSIYASFNERKYQNLETRNLYIENQSNEFSIYKKSDYQFFRDFQIPSNEYEIEIVDETIVNYDMEPLNVGSTKMHVKYDKMRMTLNLNVSHLQSMSDDIYLENEYFNYNGITEYSIGDIINLPLNAYVYYTTEYLNEPNYNKIESYCNSGVKTQKRAEKEKGQYFQYAYLFIEGYYVKEVFGCFTINDKVKNDYIKSISTANHLYIHFLNESGYSPVSPKVYKSESNKVDMGSGTVGTYGGTYIDVELGKTYSGSSGDVTFAKTDRIYIQVNSPYYFSLTPTYRSLKLDNNQYCYHLFLSIRSYGMLIEVGYAI